MKTILCVTGRELSLANEAFLMKYDDDSTIIHLFTDAISEEITLGKIFLLYEQIGIGNQGEEAWLLSDMPEYLKCIQDFFGGLFDCYVTCPDSGYEIAMHNSYRSITACSAGDRSAILRMVSNLHIIKNMSYTDTYYQSERHLMVLNEELEVISKNCRVIYESMGPCARNITNDFTEEYAYATGGQVLIIWCLSYLLQVTFSDQYVEKIYHEVQKQSYTTAQRLYIFNQLKRQHLVHTELSKMGEIEQLYYDAVAVWKSEMADILWPLKQEDRNRDKVVVLTLQFLGDRHSPTKTARERIYTIGKLLDKEVLCINTREQYTAKGFLPFYDVTIRSIVEEYNCANRIQHKDYVFNLLQPEIEMPDKDMVRALLQVIREYAPWQIVVLGDRCLLGDLCAEFIPTVCIPMAFSTIPKKQHQYVAVGKQLSEAEKRRLFDAGYKLSSIIESLFTFELVEQTTKLTRVGLGLPEDKFLLVVVGIRLDGEVTQSFMDMLAETYTQGAHVVFAGEFEKYERYCDTDPKFKAHSTFVGYQEDILALMELCDLYVNPPRVGGGFSVVEAFYKGVPGVTLNYGDVAASAGVDFCVDNLNEMKDMILHYMDDTAFYRTMSEKAIARSTELFDSKGAMKHILCEMEQRELWF